MRKEHTVSQIIVLLEFILQNYIIILLILFISAFINKIILGMNVHFRESKGFKKIKRFLIPNSRYILFSAVMLIQFKLNLFQKIEANQKIGLLIGILTMYGIIISFIQFLIGFSSQDPKDRHWGESKTKFLLQRSLEYQFLNSSEFKLMIFFVGIISFLELDFVSKYNLFQGNIILFDEIYVASIVTILYEYLKLFFRIIDIKNNIIRMQEKRDLFIKFQLEESIKNQHMELLNYAFSEGEDYFLKSIFDRISASELSQEDKKEIFNRIIFYSYSTWSLTSVKRGNNLKILRERFLGVSCFETKRYAMLHHFERLWNNEKFKELELTFEDMLHILIHQKNILYREIKNTAAIQSDNLIQLCIDFYYKESISDVHNTVLYLPKSLINSATSCNHISKLIYTFENLDIVEDVAFKFNSEDSSENIKKIDKLLVKDYCNFMKVLVDKIYNQKMYVDRNFKFSYAMDLHEDKDAFVESASISDYIFRDHLKKIVILEYIRSLENTEENKIFILKICNLLDHYQITAYIIYRIFYPSHDYMGWDKEIEFFQKLYQLKDQWFSQIKMETIDLVASEIESTHIGHRISYNLIKWTLEQITKPVTEELIQNCIDKDYLSFGRFVKLRFIINGGDYLNVDKYCYDKLAYSRIVNKYSDWRVHAIKELTSKPEYLSLSYLKDQVCYIMRQLIKEGIPSELLEINFIEPYIIGFMGGSFDEIVNQCIASEEKMLLGIGVIDYLMFCLIKRMKNDLDKKEVRDEKFIRILLWKSLNYHNLSLSEYVDMIGIKVTLIKDNISKCEKEMANNMFSQMLGL